jgi:hypothetical protein
MSTVTKEELISYIKSLELTLGEKEARDNIFQKDKKRTWDTIARHYIGEKMFSWFQEYFGSRTLGDKWENCFGYEGQNQNFAIKSIKRKELFSSMGCYPDMYFVKPIKIAIELDHGKKGSALKNALAKTGFDKLSGKWVKAFVLFFDESREHKIKKALKSKDSKEVLEFYREKLNTEVIVI